MQLGTILSLVSERECGRIKTNSGEEAHFHNSCLWNTLFSELSEGQDVEFEIQRSHRGFLAFHIRLHTKDMLLKT
jgi:cold shock CspA family protein